MTVLALIMIGTTSVIEYYYLVKYGQYSVIYCLIFYICFRKSKNMNIAHV